MVENTKEQYFHEEGTQEDKMAKPLTMDDIDEEDIDRVLDLLEENSDAGGLSSEDKRIYDVLIAQLRPSQTNRFLRTLDDLSEDDFVQYFKYLETGSKSILDGLYSKKD